MEGGRYTRVFLFFSKFISLQLFVQCITAFTGFLILRYLSVEQFAQYALAFSFQCTISQLIDLGSSSAIVALVGHNTDSHTLSSYINTALYYRRTLLIFVGVLGSITFWLITRNHGWSTSTRIILLTLVLIAVTFQLLASCYSSALAVKQKIGDIYIGQLYAGVFRILAVFGAFSFHFLTASIAAAINGLGFAIIGFSNRAKASVFLSSSADSSLDSRKCMLKYLAPMLPSTIFAAVQGQFALFLIAVLGKTSNVAEVGALARFGQLFVLLSAFNSTVIAPYIAKQSPTKLVKRYMEILTASTVFSIMLLATANCIPHIFLWLLGPHYEHLRSELSWSLAANCAGYLFNVVWIMNTARKWVSWLTSSFEVLFIVCGQLFSILTMDLATTTGVLKLSLLTTTLGMTPHLLKAAHELILQKSRTSANLEILEPSKKMFN